MRLIESNFPEFEPTILSCIKRELEGLSKSNMSAKVALLVYRDVDVLETDGNGDQCILDNCRRNNYALLSSDRELLSKARSNGVKTLTVQDGRRIVWH